MFHRCRLIAAMLLGFVSAGGVSAQTPAKLWPELLKSDSAPAYRAMRQLAAMPEDTLRFLSATVPAAERTATDRQIAALIGQLDSDAFAERDKAQQELEARDWEALPALRKAMLAGGNLELKRRLEQLVRRAEGPPTGASLRWHRTVELVEWIGGKDAKVLLERWTRGAVASPLTVEAKRVLARWDGQGRVGVAVQRPAVDSDGEPLPAGVIRRLGSMRWRLGQGTIGYDGGGTVYSADGKRLIVNGGSSIGILDAQSGKVLLQRASPGYVNGVQLSPDGRRLVLSGSIYANMQSTPYVQVWDAADLKEIATWAYDGTVLGFADGGKQLILTTNNGLRRVDATTGQEVSVIPFGKGREGKVRAFNGTTVVVCRGSQLRYFDLANPDAVRTVATPDREPRCVALAVNGRYFATGSDGDDYGVLLYELERGELLRHLVSKNATRHAFIVGLAFAPDGKTLAFSDSAKEAELVLWDLETHRPRWKAPGHAGQLVFSPDGKHIAGNSGSRTRVWETATGKELSGSDKGADGYSDLEFSADGRSLVAVQGTAACLLDFPSGKELRRFVQPDLHRAVLSPDGRRLATSAFNHDLRIWDAETGRELCQLPDRGGQEGFARRFQFTADSRRLCAWEANFRLFVWDVATGRLLAEHRPRPDGFPADRDDDGPRRRDDRAGGVLHTGYSFCFDADAVQFLWCFQKLRAYDTASGKLLRTFDGESSDLDYQGPSLSRDGALLLRGAGAAGVALLDLRHGKVLGRLPFGTGVHSNARGLAPDGRAFAVATYLHAHGQLTLYEAATLQPRLVLPLAFQHANGLSFSLDGRFLAVRFSDRSALIWDLHDPRL